MSDVILPQLEFFSNHSIASKIRKANKMNKQQTFIGSTLDLEELN